MSDPGSTTGILHLLPVAIAEGTTQSVLPPATLAAACSLRRFVVENARSARRALKDMGHPTPMQELDIRELPPSKDRTPMEASLLAELLAPLALGESVGVLSESGCPGIADPGAELARWAQAQGIRVVPHVGPSSLLLALMGSGLEGQRFSFHGYLPVEPADRVAALQRLEQRSARERAAQLFIETPYRNQAILAAMLETLHADTWVTVAADLTAASQSLHTRSIAGWRALAAELPRVPTVFVLQAAPAAAPAAPTGPGGARRRRG
jgi:16S rRNA (cytidine1402-2'-O)-methyltransferase